MADAVVIREFLATMGYRVDESSQRRFMDAISAMTKEVELLGAGIAAAAAAVVAGVTKMAESGAQMHYLSLRIVDTASNIDALVFSLTKMGVSAPAAIASLTGMADALRNDPGLRSRWEAYAGHGSLTEQIQQFSKVLQTATPEMRRVLHEMFGSLNISEEFWLAMTRPGITAGMQESIGVQRLFKFDPNAFAEQSLKFEHAYADLQLRLNTIWSHISQGLIDGFTESFIALTQFLDDHAIDITTIVDGVLDHVRKDGIAIGHAISDLIILFESLGPSGQSAAIGVGVLAAAFMLPGWFRMTVIAILLTKLLEDYEQFRKTGKSDLDIPWLQLGEALRGVLHLIEQIGIASHGLITPWTILGVVIGFRVLRAVISFFSALTTGAVSSAAVVQGTLVATFTNLLSVMRAIMGLGLLGAVSFGIKEATDAAADALLDAIYGKGHAEEVHKLQRQGAPDFVPEWMGGKRPGETTPQAAPQEQQGGDSIWTKMYHLLQFLNPISAAKAEELPDNVKMLSNNVSDLNQTLSDMVERAVSPLIGGQGGGGGAGDGGGGDSGRHVDPLKLNDPKVAAAVKFFMGRGYSMVAAIGIVSNLYAESGLDPTAVGQGGVGVGVAQWDKARQQEFRMVEGVDVAHATREQQYDFIDYELRHKEKAAGDMLNAATSIREAVGAVYHGYERPASYDQSLPNRLGIGATLARNPNINNTSNTGPTVNQTNNVNISGVSDPNDAVRQWRAEQERHWSDVNRNLSNAYN